MLFKKKSILFFFPDYYSSFFLSDELRKCGWRSDILLPKCYSEELTYSHDAIHYPYTGSNSFLLMLQNWLLFIYLMLRYKCFLIYDVELNFIPLLNYRFELENFNGFSLSLALAKFFRKKIIYMPSGHCDCLSLKEVWDQFDGEKCFHCWRYMTSSCNDLKREKLINRANKYTDTNFVYIMSDQMHLNTRTFFCKSLDLELWSPDIKVPEKFLVDKKNDELLILHSFSDPSNSRKDQKGSSYVLKAVKQLINEGFKINFIHPRNVHIKDMRYYQVQADIVVEQLISGTWGATGIETIALGKPVICYIRPDFKRLFYKEFPDANPLPFIEANPESIYNVLKELVEDKQYRIRKGKESRKFAEKFADKRKNGKEFSEILLSLLDDKNNANMSKTNYKVDFGSKTPIFSEYKPIPGDKLQDSLIPLLKDGLANIALYGAGLHTKRLLNQSDLFPMKIKCIIDDNPQISQIKGFKVISPKQFYEYDVDAIVVSSDITEDKIYKKAKSWIPENIKVVKIYN